MLQVSQIYHRNHALMRVCPVFNDAGLCRTKNQTSPSFLTFPFKYGDLFTHIVKLKTISCAFSEGLFVEHLLQAQSDLLLPTLTCRRVSRTCKALNKEYWCQVRVFEDFYTPSSPYGPSSSTLPKPDSLPTSAGSMKHSQTV
jgi:hypothetical protein